VATTVTAKPGTRALLLGNEAIARGAIEGGVRVVAAYPGTPASEIVETLAELADSLGFYAEWSVNEKVAFEIAAGASLTGVRALTAMKNAGFNWVMDTFMTLGYGGVRGGLVIVVADDPGAHYSSNEQDTRFAARWANLPCLEPEDQQEAKEMTRQAFALSEQLELPVIVRSATRLSHSRGVVTLGEVEPSDMTPGFNKHWRMTYRWNVYGPPGPVAKHAWQLARLPQMRDLSEASPFNELREGRGDMGLVASGVGAAYAREALHSLGLEEEVALWKVGVVYPLAETQALRLLAQCPRVLVVEDGGPVVETQLRLVAQNAGRDVVITGKLFEGVFPLHGEMDTDRVRTALARMAGVPQERNPERIRVKERLGELAIPRSSTLCAGCPHLGTYWALRQVLAEDREQVPIVNGDIGCYEQAGYGVKGEVPQASDAPSQAHPSDVLYNLLDTLYVMGSGVSMAQGQRRAGYEDGAVVAVAGDSTFFHACMPALVNAVWNGTKLTFIVMDNSWTAMTGHQACPATGLDARGAPATTVRIEEVARAVGAGWVRVVDPYRLDETEQAIREALEFDGVVVLVTRGECALQVQRRTDSRPERTMVTEECIGCGTCVELGCPAIVFQEDVARIDELLCVSCGICAQLCPVEAIVASTGEEE